MATANSPTASASTLTLASISPSIPRCKSFRTQYAIDGDQPWADVTVRIKLDGKVAYEKTHVTSGVLSDVVNIDLNGAKTLTLEVDYGENYDVQDRLNWIEPALLRSGGAGK